MVRYAGNWLFILAIAALCALAVPTRSCSREVAHVHAR